MVSRELYLRKVRPFIGTDVVKAITGMRRSGKSALLELIQAELRQRQSVARAGGGARRDPERSRPVALRALAAGENRHVPLDASFSFSRVELAPGETFEVPNRPKTVTCPSTRVFRSPVSSLRPARRSRSRTVRSWPTPVAAPASRLGSRCAPCSATVSNKLGKAFQGVK